MDRLMDGQKGRQISQIRLVFVVDSDVISSTHELFTGRNQLTYFSLSVCACGRVCAGMPVCGCVCA